MKLLKINYIRYGAYSIFLLLACVFILKEAKIVLAPLVVSILLSFVLNPALEKINHFVKNRLASTIILLLVLFSLISGVLSLLTIQILSFYEDFPDISEQMVIVTKSVEELLEDNLGIRNVKVNEKIDNATETFLNSGTNFFGTVLDNIGDFLVYLSIVPIYVFFLLYYKTNIINYVKKILTPLKIKASPVIKEVSIIIQDYLKGMMIVMLILAVLNSLSLLILGVPYAIVLGVITALFTIVPYIGVIVGGLLVLSVSLFTQGDPETLYYILVMFGVIQFIEGNFLTPKIVGDKININPMLAILALLIGEQLWGIVGMVIALPITAVILIIIKNINKETFYPKGEELLKL